MISYLHIHMHNIHCIVIINFVNLFSWWTIELSSPSGGCQSSRPSSSLPSALYLTTSLMLRPRSGHTGQRRCPSMNMTRKCLFKWERMQDSTLYIMLCMYLYDGWRGELLTTMLGETYSVLHVKNSITSCLMQVYSYVEQKIHNLCKINNLQPPIWFWLNYFALYIYYTIIIIIKYIICSYVHVLYIHWSMYPWYNRLFIMS